MLGYSPARLPEERRANFRETLHPDVLARKVCPALDSPSPVRAGRKLHFPIALPLWPVAPAEEDRSSGQGT